MGFQQEVLFLVGNERGGLQSTGDLADLLLQKHEQFSVCFPTSVLRDAAAALLALFTAELFLAQF